MSYLLVGVIAGLISLGRLFLTNTSVLGELVWAEDGLFPLCIGKYGYWGCLWEPYSGYLPFLSRTLALPVSFFPLDLWPSATNIVAAVAFGLMGALLYWLFRRIPLKSLVAGLLAIAPLLLPIVGLEAVNAAGSAYMMWLVIAAVVVCVPVARPIPTWIAAAILLIAALTIPIAVFLIIPIGIQIVRRNVSFTTMRVPLLALLIGTLVQAWMVLTAQGQRRIGVSGDSLIGWIEGLSPTTAELFGFRLSLTPTGRMAWFGSDLDAVIGIGVAVALLVASVVALLSHKQLVQSSGLLILTGLVLSAVPSITGFENNRYFVVLACLLVIASVLALVGLWQETSQYAPIVLLGVLLIIWLPSLAASPFRSNAEPRWTEMMATVRSQCADDPALTQVNLVFTPMWPYVDAPDSPLTNAVLACP